MPVGPTLMQNEYTAGTTESLLYCTSVITTKAFKVLV